MSRRPGLPLKRPLGPGPVANGIAAVVAVSGAWVLAARLLPSGLPPGIVVEGAISGGLLAVAACGVVLVYRADRVVNFAQAGIGSIAAVCAVGLSTHYGWPWALSATTGLVAGTGIGALASVCIVDRMRRAPRLAATVATIGIGEVLAGGADLLGHALPTRSRGRRFGVPLHATLSVRPALFHADALVAIAGTALLLCALLAGLYRTSWGLAFRAAAEDRERAFLAGIPIGNLSLATWAATGGLAAAAVILKAPLDGAPAAGTVAIGGSALLLRVLAAATVGGFGDLRRTIVAAVGIGVVDQAATWAFNRTVYVDVLLVGIVLIALLAQKERFTRRGETSTARLAVREARPLSAAAASLPLVRIGRPVLATLVVGAAVMFPAWARPSQDRAGAVVCVYAIVAVSLLLLTGWAGFVSLGQFAVAGMGGAVTAVLFGRHGWDITVALAAGMAVAAAVAVVAGLPTLRVHGPAAAVTTLALAVAASSYLLVHRFVPWLVDDQIQRPVLWHRINLQGEGATYEVCLAGVLAAVLAARNLRRSRAGRALLAVRDNEAAAAAAGIPVLRVKLAAFAVAGALAGLAGGLYVIVQQGFQTESYTPEASVRLFAMVIVGGLSSISGVVLGAVVIRGTEVLFPSGWALLASGFGITALVAFFPDGLGGALTRLRDLAVSWALRRGTAAGVP